MSSEPTDVDKIRRLPWLVAHNAANSVFCTLTFFGPIFLLFLGELGLPKMEIGFLLSLLPFCGLLAPFLAGAVARQGLRRTFLIFWTLRKGIAALLLLTPWVVWRFGAGATFPFVVVIVLGFALCRAVGETAFNPWVQELVPDSIRGKFAAVSRLLAGGAGATALAIGSFVIGRSTGLDRFMVLIAAGVAFGFLSVALAIPMPGGAAVQPRAGRHARLKEALGTLKDRNFARYLVGIGAVTLALHFLAFVPLFLKEQVGLDAGQVTRLQTWTLASGIVASFAWGWAADRFGSKPVMLSGLSFVALLPICWALIPRHSPWSVRAAVSVALLSGVGSSGWVIGSMRLLYVSLVPREKKSEYMAVWYAWIGLAGGGGSLIAGAVLDMFRGTEGEFLILKLDHYTPIFAGATALMIAGAAVLRHIEAERGISTMHFAAMFLRGSPLMALESMVGFSRAMDERTRVAATERLGTARSPLNVDELLEALADPSFNVRYEAIISVTRTHPDRRLTDALTSVLEGNEPDLSAAAVWALGRIGDTRTAGPLREALETGYPLLRARSARALATLGDTEAIPTLLERFRSEPDAGLRIAYASALGALRVEEATAELLGFLRDVNDASARMELALALARTLGHERMFMRLWRQMRTAPGTAASRAVLSMRRKLTRLRRSQLDLVACAERCAQAFARNDMAAGTALLASLIRTLPLERLAETAATVLGECAQRLDESGPVRPEYLLLSLHALAVG